VLLIAMLAMVSALLYNGSRGGAIARSAVPKLVAQALVLTPQPPVWGNSQLDGLAQALRGAFAPALRGAGDWSLTVVGADGRTLYADGATRAVTPASVQKLIVASAALDELGPQFRYHTIFAAPQNAGDGTLDGNLWLVGSGDPSLTTADLRNGVAMLARSGLQRVNGGVVVDATAMAGPGLNPYWNRDDAGQDYAAPTSAVSLDGDTIESHASVGGVDQTLWTPMTDVARYVAAQTQSMMRARNILLERPPALGTAPLDAVVLWDHRSAPLSALEAHMLFVSDNHYAEQLLRTLGQDSDGIPNDANGIAAEMRFLKSENVPVPGLRLFDGSGLSPADRVASVTLARLLAAQEPALYRLLPLGGREGTLRRYDFTTAEGRVRAKSGHLSGVSSLAGYANTLHHGRVAFAFLIDGSPGDPDAAIVRAIDRLVEF
jgi:D-alanyl-D-alanine carboxypeptidase/D-alanyl-D-alanine-endopeptidase (penicillin-binding protein 4)